MMGRETKIQWCDSTVNPVAGCDGCELWKPRPEGQRGDRSVRGGTCYAGNLHTRFQGGSKAYALPFEVVEEKPGRMCSAASWADLRGVARPSKPWIPDESPRLIFISDMGDALSDAIGFRYLLEEVIEPVQTCAAGHVWLWLTKRPGRMVTFSQWLMDEGEYWPDELVAMTSVTGPGTEKRVEQLSRVLCKYRGVSCEPLRGEPDWSKVFFPFASSGVIDWCIVGGESGGYVVPMDLAWVERALEWGATTGVPVFVKQLGSHWGSGRGDTHGGDWSEWPARLRVREMPRFLMEGTDA